MLFLSPPEGMSRKAQRRSLDTMRKLNESRFQELGDPEILTQIASYEMAYRMQASVPELLDISREPASIHELYGTEPGKVSFANNCLLARRLVERGVRFVELYHRGWDHHGGSERGDIAHGLARLVPGDRACGCGARPGPQAKRPLEEHLDRLGWGIWSYADEPGALSQIPGPGSPPQGIHHVDGRRGSKTGDHDRPDG